MEKRKGGEKKEPPLIYAGVPVLRPRQYKKREANFSLFFTLLKESRRGGKKDALFLYLTGRKSMGKGGKRRGKEAAAFSWSQKKGKKKRR